MPTYEYVCDDCSHEFEEFHSITAPPLDTCPKCKGAVRRLISSGNGLIFKGSGFYITDYKNKSGASTDAKKESSSKPEKSEKKTSEKKAESKKSET